MKYEKLKFKIAWLMPRWLVYLCAIRLGAHATTGDYGHTIVPDLKFMDALERWENRKPVGTGDQERV